MIKLGRVRLNLWPSKRMWPSRYAMSFAGAIRPALSTLSSAVVSLSARRTA